MVELNMIEFIAVDGERVGDIKMFALSTCGWCKKTKGFFADKGIAYEYVDVDTLPDEDADEVVARQRHYNASGSFPTIVVNETDIIVGYDLEALKKLTGNENE